MNGLAFSLGWLLIGITPARAGFLPRLPALLAIISGVPLGVSPGLVPARAGKVGAVFFGLGVISLGDVLLSEKTLTGMQGDLQ